MRALVAAAVLCGTASADPPERITDAACVKAMFPAANAGRIGPAPTDELVTQVEVIPLGPTIACRVDHHPDAGSDTTTELGVLDNHQLRAQRIASHAHAVNVTAFVVSSAESVLIVDEIDHSDREKRHIASTVYRGTPAGLTAILAFEQSGEPCALTASSTYSGALPDLALRCDRHLKRYRWNGAKYLER